MSNLTFKADIAAIGQLIVWNVRRAVACFVHEVVMLDNKTLSAGLANVRTSHTVSLAVFVQIIFARERLVTQITTVHLFPGM